MILVSNGNKKIGNDTLIINMTSATDCPSKRIGMCPIENNKCYALKAERCYPQVLPYRRKQEVYWGKTPAHKIAEDLRNIILRKRNPIKYIRFSESGDFAGQSDVDKMNEVAENVPEVQFYGYTARRDLRYDNISSNCTINGSSFMVSNMFTAIRDTSGHDIVCPGNCRGCDLCKMARGLDIKIATH